MLLKNEANLRTCSIRQGQAPCDPSGALAPLAIAKIIESLLCLPLPGPGGGTHHRSEGQGRRCTRNS